jgi:hypothetical protein
MENTDKPKGNNEMPKDPKPGDEVQMHIETVIPEAEKESENSEGGEFEEKPKSSDADQSKEKPEAKENNATETLKAEQESRDSYERDQIE